ncbi:phosphotransferase [Kroppenstedtia pulmonis]|uniref:Phosphotransferase n=1 Tax=Kroppenstedtia pulmonis TaxID=1380685 RepID=A0A7D3XI11_9BACL|nr:phosphotransferase [Kroppenstedtia pulmonis]QKG84124.1 phosphotransferase [Kroppenstedtia pulmonis]
MGKQFGGRVTCVKEVAGVRERWERILGKKIHQVVPYRRNHLLVTTKEKWIVKSTSGPEYIQWWIQVDQELRLRGFNQMPSLKTDGGQWVLSRWIDGENASYSRKKDILQTADMLARFHLAGRGLWTYPGRTTVWLPDRLSIRLSTFSRHLREEKQQQNELTYLLHRYGPHFYRMGREALTQLRRIPLKAHTYWERHCHCLTHRDLASHNVLVDRSGIPWLIDFETADYDCQVGDLWQLLSRSLSEQNWDPDIYESVLKVYESIRPLSPLEKIILPKLLAFPNEFFREMSGLIRKRSGYDWDHTLPYLETIIESLPQWLNFIRKIN